MGTSKDILIEEADKHKQAYKTLVKAIKEWWEEHQYEVVCTKDDEYNVYDEPPEFVKLIGEE